MKKFTPLFLLTLLIATLSYVNVSAETVTINHLDHGKSVPLEATVHDPVVVDQDDYEAFDYGLYLDLEYGLTENLDIGVHNTWEVNRQELTSLVGATYRFGRK